MRQPQENHVLGLTRYTSTYCEKQIISSSTSFLYCSEACRKHDLPSSGQSHQTSLSNSPTSPSFSSGTYPSYVRSISTVYPSSTDRDIIPRASPTAIRPRSYYASDPYPTKTATLSSSRPSNNSSSSALASLRELSAALENTRTDVHSRRGSLASNRPIPQSSTESGSDADGEDGEGESAQTSGTTSPVSRSASGVWSYMTFAGATSKSTNTMPPPKQLAKSYTTPQPVRSNSNYSYGAYAGAASLGYASYANSNTGPRDSTTTYRYAQVSYATPLATAASGLVGMERPLPPRSGGYSHRPRSMDLVTPYSLAYGA